MPRWRSNSIQSDVVARWFLRAVTEPASWTAPPYRRNFSVSVVLPASGCEIIANVRRREICCSIKIICVLVNVANRAAKALTMEQGHAPQPGGVPGLAARGESSLVWRRQAGHECGHGLR